MGLPRVAIIGRPNVGKSSLLNALSGERISIVEPTAGVTRDRVSTVIEKDGRYFELIDTGGYGVFDSGELAGHIKGQIRQAIESADMVLFMTDVRDGVVPLDKQIAGLLRKHGLDVIGVANKADTPSLLTAAGEFAGLGFGEFACISVTNNLNKSVLLDKIMQRLKDHQCSPPARPRMKIAIVGRRNAGKSTLLNAIVGSDRVIVHSEPGTTRDAVDVSFEKDGQQMVVIDTAGVRKKRKISGSIEYYGYVRVLRSIRRADVVLFVLDATLPVSQVDKKLARLLAEEYKSCILVVNKWDLARDKAVSGDYGSYLTELLPALRYSPIAFTTAAKGTNVPAVLDLATALFKQANTQIPTAKWNKAFEMIQAQRFGTGKHKRRGLPKIYYATQVAANPITVLLFVNQVKLFDENYRRFLMGRLHLLLPTDEVPIRLLTRRRRD